MIRLPQETIDRLWSEVAVARKWMKKEYQQRWIQSGRLYGGDHWAVANERSGELDLRRESGLLRTTANWIAPTVQSGYCSVTTQDPEFTVSPRGIHDPVIEAGLSKYVTEEFLGAWGAWRAVQQTTLNSGVYGAGMLRVGWHVGDLEIVPFEDEEAADIAEADAIQQELYAELAFNPGVAAKDLQQPAPEWETRVVGAGPRAVAISPYDMIIPRQVHSHDFEDGPFAGCSYICPLSEVERWAAETYPKEGKGSLKSFAYESMSIYGGDGVLNPVDRSLEAVDGDPLIPIYEVWFKRVHVPRPFTTKVSGSSVRLPAGEYPLRIRWAVDRPEAPLDCDLWPHVLRGRNKQRSFPFRVLFAREVPGQLIGQGVPEVAQQPQQAMNLCLSMELTDAKQSARRRYLLWKNAIEPEGRAALEDSTAMNVFIETNAPPGSQPILRLEDGGTPLELEQLRMSCRDVINATTFVGDSARAVDTPGTPTATEVNARVEQSGTVGAKQNRKVEDLCIWAAQAQWELLRLFGDVEEPVSVTDPTGESQEPMSVDIGAHLELPVLITVLTGAKRAEQRQAAVTNHTTFIQVADSTRMLQTPGNPMGIIDGRERFRQLAIVLDIGGDPDKLFVPPQAPPAMIGPDGLPIAPSAVAPMDETPGAGDAGLSGAPPTAPLPPSPPSQQGEAMGMGAMGEGPLPLQAQFPGGPQAGGAQASAGQPPPLSLEQILALLQQLQPAMNGNQPGGG